jgi:hypothetical protein
MGSTKLRDRREICQSSMHDDAEQPKFLIPRRRRTEHVYCFEVDFGESTSPESAHCMLPRNAADAVEDRPSMKINLLPLLLLAAVANEAFAGCGNSPSYLDQTQVNTILTNNFACGKSTGLAPPGWNEKHLSTGVLQEQHAGAATVENVGTWATSNSSGRGRVTYTYSGGTVFTYEVAVHINGNCNSPPPGTCTTLPQAYDFCRVSPDTTTFSIYVSTAFQAPSGGAMNANCPSNP